jgi:hypothetical protein
LTIFEHCRAFPKWFLGRDGTIKGTTFEHYRALSERFLWGNATEIGRDGRRIRGQGNCEKHECEGDICTHFFFKLMVCFNADAMNVEEDAEDKKMQSMAEKERKGTQYQKKKRNGANSEIKRAG